MTERWKPIPGFERYQVSDLGRVRSKKKNGFKILKLTVYRNFRPTGLFGPPPSGKITHLSVGLSSSDGWQKKFQVHRLVLFVFVGPCPANMEGCHNDGDASNNRLSNLRWDTPVSNQADVKKHSGRKDSWRGVPSGRRVATCIIDGALGFSA